MLLIGYRRLKVRELMENGPKSFDDESELESKDKDFKKKKTRKNLGSFLVSDKQESKQAEASKDEPEKQPKKPEKAESAEKPTSELTEDEKQLVEQEYVRAYQDESQKAPVESPEETAAEEAVADFHERIEQGEDSESAFQETLQELQDTQEQENEADQFDTEHKPESTPQSKPESANTKRWPNFAELIVPSSEVQSRAHAQPQVQQQIEQSAFINHPLEPFAPKLESSSKTEKPEEQSNPLAAAITTGIVGYLIGRRRGRISAEKKLSPVKQKLEKQVQELGQNLAQKEEIIRQEARKQAFISKTHSEQLQVKTQEFRAVPQIHEINLKDKAPNKLGYGSPAQETIFERKSEKTKTVVEAAKVTKHAEVMKKSELMAISRKIRVDGTSLKQIYDSHLISERALRRLVATHLRGGNLQKALRKEMIQREIDFERDPVLRDQEIRHVEQSKAEHLSAMMYQNAGAAFAENPTDLNIKAVPIVKKKIKESKNSIAADLRPLDVLLSSVIAILSVVVIFLLFRNY